jgi:alkanesulfonate monooxygenase SsuD/methylene tetrahydromethanopterin reductase-like flavin-dependent oxidoreductase (luciferase family)
MAATLQHVSGGRLILGLGAGGGVGTPYAIEQEALGRPVPADPERRRSLERTIAVLRQVWSGTVPPAAGFLRPEPAPPIVVAGFGPKMAELAGRVGDGICVPAGSKSADLVAVARRARAKSDRDPEQLLVIVSLPSVARRVQPWDDLGVDRLIAYVAPPFEEGIAQLAAIRP